MAQIGSESDTDYRRRREYPIGQLYVHAAAFKITGFQPHMHNRGKRECLEAMYPNGIPRR